MLRRRRLGKEMYWDEAGGNSGGAGGAGLDGTALRSIVVSMVEDPRVVLIKVRVWVGAFLRPWSLRFCDLKKGG